MKSSTPASRDLSAASYPSHSSRSSYSSSALRKSAALVYLYGFTPGDARLPPLAHGVEDGSPVLRVEHQDIAALVSLVPAAAYEEQPLEEHLKDPCWLAVRVERHNRVLLEVLQYAAVAPCRFGTLFRDAAAVKKVIARHRLSLAKVLRKLEGRQEWSVKAYLPPIHIAGRGHDPIPGCLEIGIVSPERGDMTRFPAVWESGSCPRNESRGEGSAYLLGLVRQRAARQEAERCVHAHAKRITAHLAELAEDMAPLPLRNSENGKRTLFLNLACLVKDVETRTLPSRFAKLAAMEKKKNIILTWSGPWPAYSFAGGL